MKQVSLMRHAKSSWKHAGLSDIDRPLNKRGLHDAPMMGKRLASIGFTTDRIVSSPATRALVTAQTIARQIGYNHANIQVEQDVYLADIDTLYESIRQLDDSVQTVMFFGHNPGLTIMANDIGDSSIDHMPTCSIAVFDLPIDSWSEVAPGCGKLSLFDFPKNTHEQP